MNGELLCPQQRICLQLYAEGKCIKEIASSLKIANKTVEYHLGQIKQKLKVRSPQLLVHAALALGIVSIAFRAKLDPVSSDYTHD